ncbi:MULTISPECIES: Fic family protein [unclassified Mesorhizobium]|uniref:Fic family protein n=1 Tax=unclassified Mesorhizobium TaxID=325217 RepID=UPI001FE0C2B6|nr:MULTISPECIES: Fic family protein [unclassified Mesorhizobium]
MADLESRDFLRGLDRETCANQAAEALSQLNSIHPFREGNGCVQREFFAALAEKAGHPLEFGVISDERMTFVSVAAHERDDLASVRRMFAEITEVAQQAIERSDPCRLPTSQHGMAATWQRPSRAKTIAAGSAAQPGRTS